MLIAQRDMTLRFNQPRWDDGNGGKVDDQFGRGCQWWRLQRISGFDEDQPDLQCQSELQPKDRQRYEFEQTTAAP
jgi:hypothetical protein